jgi:hypothetical protein
MADASELVNPGVGPELLKTCYGPANRGKGSDSISEIHWKIQVSERLQSLELTE